ncbi:aldo/keto reductase [Nocardia sp. BMG111209]|uniref:aldo/keto reductase n=1 Tax=Nocardia sp. BMG111209 TaxID=1160137 RepID=UPI0003A30A75|nr:aldo/keto reductase [Nocardia sp. BMG111209]
MTLPSRTLGRTGVEVSVLGYGAMELRGAEYMGGPDISDADAGRLLNELLDAGVTLIDTSIDYGHSEDLIGRHLGARRDEYFLASKCGCPPSLPPGVMPMPDTHDFGAANVRAGVEQSLTRLRTDHLDLVQVHLSPSRSEMATGGTIETLEALRAEGKVRFLGMSGTLPNLPGHLAMDVFDEFQIPYSALQPEHDTLISDAARAGAGVIVRGGTARGTAAADKNFTVQPLSGSGPSALDRWQAARLDELLDGMSRHEFVLRFTISHPAVASTIVGTADPEHFRANVAIVARGPLPADVYAEARKRLDLAPIA